jgi:sugar phosphate isomerase/epimerase
MQIGISSYTLPWSIGVRGFPHLVPRLTAQGLLEEAHRLGVHVVQFADNLPLHDLSAAELRRLSAMASEWGIEIEVGTRGVEPSHLLSYLDIAMRVGARLLRTLTYRADGLQDLDHTARWIREVLPAFAASGVAIAIENYERHTSAEFRRLVEDIASPWFGICLDTVNSLGALESPRVVVAELGDYVLNLHVKDFRIGRSASTMGFEVTGCAAGDGRLDVPWLLEEMRTRGRDPNLIIELWPPYPGSIEEAVKTEREWCERSVHFMKQTVAAVVAV